MRTPNIAVATALIVGCASIVYGAEPRNIGTAVAIKNQVTAADEQKVKHRLMTQDPVRELETLEATRDSEGQFSLADNTKLALGPNARIVLDKFVYDPDKTAGRISLNFVKGAFRFITGDSNRDAYTIKTPVVSLGVRGTVFDGYVADSGAMAILLHDGAINVCPASAHCLVHGNRKRRLVYVSRRGKIITRAKWDGSLLPGVSIRKAFPFLGRKLAIDQKVRLRYADLLSTRIRRTTSVATQTATIGWSSGYSYFGIIGTGSESGNSGIAGPFGGARSGGVAASGATGGGSTGASGGSTGGGSKGGGGPGNGNGNSGNSGNGGGNTGGSGPGSGNGGGNNGQGGGAGNGGGGSGNGGNGGGGHGR
jgi:FecR protein